MALSPREELRITEVIAFREDSTGLWYWDLDALDGIEKQDGPGYHSLRDAVLDFAKMNGYHSKVYAKHPEAAHLSKIVEVTPREYHMRKYAFGAPDPFDAGDPTALASVGYTPMPQNWDKG